MPSPQTLWSYAGEAMEAMFAECPGFQFQQGDLGWFLSTELPVPDFNCAFVAPQAQPSKRLETLVARFKKRGVPFLVCCPPRAVFGVQPAAQKLGLQPIGELPMMTLEPSSALAVVHDGGVTVVRIETEEQLEQAADIGSRSFGIGAEILQCVFNPAVIANPRIAIFMAMVEGEPAAVVTTTAHEEAVGIWSMVTAPEFRRQGVATHLLRHVLAEFSQKSLCFLLATVEGRFLYQKEGFDTPEVANVWCGGLSL